MDIDIYIKQINKDLIDFTNECLSFDSLGRIEQHLVYEHYLAWCDKNKIIPGSNHRLFRFLRLEFGIKDTKSNGKRIMLGIAYRNHETGYCPICGKYVRRW